MFSKDTVRRNTAALTTAACAFLLAGCSTPAGADNKGEGGGLTASVMGGTPSFNYGAVYAMESLSLDKENSIDVEYSGVTQNSGLSVAALLAGDYDFINIGAPSAFDALASGKKLKIVACTNAMIGDLVLRKDVMERLGLRADSSIAEKVEALRGLTIVTNPTGSSFSVALRQILTHYGLDPDKDLKIVGTGDAAAVVAGIKQGHFDGGFWSSAVLEGNVATGEAEVLINLARGDVRDVVGEALDMSGVMVATDDFVASKPDVVEAVYNSLAAGADAIHGDPKATGIAVKQAWYKELPQDVFDSVWADAPRLYPAGASCEKGVFEAQLKYADEATEKDYSKISYDDVVYDSAKKK